MYKYKSIKMKNITVFFLLFICAGLSWAGFWLPPTELSSLLSKRNNDKVKLSWTTANEADNMGFEIERRLYNEKEFAKVGFVDGFGTSQVATNYTFTDKNESKEESYYRLRQLDISGAFYFSDTVAVKGFLSDNPHTIVTYAAEDSELNIQFGLLLATQTNANVKIVDMKGKAVQEFAVAAASHKSFGIDMLELAAGNYFIFIDFNDKSRQVLEFAKP